MIQFNNTFTEADMKYFEDFIEKNLIFLSIFCVYTEAFTIFAVQESHSDVRSTVVK